MSKQNSQRVQTALSLLSTYGTRSTDAISAHLSKDFTHHVMPTSVGVPPRTLEKWVSDATGLLDSFKTFYVVPVEIYEDIIRNTVIIHVEIESQLESRVKSSVKELGNEAVMFIKISEDQKSVVEVREFVDSAFAKEAGGH